MERRYLKEKNAMIELDCCRATLRRAAEKADAVVHLGRAIRYDMEKFEEYFQTERQKRKEAADGDQED